jgi:hypothetical protein
LVLPDRDEIPNVVRIEKLALKPVLSETTQKEKSLADSRLYDACIQFAIDGSSWLLCLSFDVSYVCAYPCAGGPHPLFHDYVHKAVKVNEILTIRDWGGLSNVPNLSLSAGDTSEQISSTKQDKNDAERVLVIEAFGIPDYEVLARAWASHWGLSAIVASLHKTW